MEGRLPEGWVEARLGDLGAWGSGGTPSRHNPNFYSGGEIPWMKIGDLNDGLVIESEEHITKEGLSNSAARLVQPGALLVALYGSIGKLGVNAVECATNQAIAHFIPAPSTVDRDFAFWAILKHRDDLVSLGQGGTQQNISQKIIKDFAIPLPPLNEQRRIVARLQELTTRTKAARAALEAIPPLLDRFRQSVLAAAFRGDLTADWRAKNPDVEPASELLKRIRVERRRRWEEAGLEKARSSRYRSPEPPSPILDLPNLPTAWVWATLDELMISMRNGVSTKPDRDSGVPVLRISALRPLSLDMSDVRYLDKAFDVGPFTLVPGDILFTRYNGNAELVGSCAVVSEDPGPLTYPDKLIRVRVVADLIIPECIAIMATSGITRRLIREHSKSAAGQVGISGSDLRSIPIPVPPKEEQQAIVSKVTGIMQAAGRYEVEREQAALTLTTLHQSLLSKAFRGELVPQDPDDEPASVLLERIRKEREAAGANGQRKRARRVGQ